MTRSVDPKHTRSGPGSTGPSVVRAVLARRRLVPGPRRLRGAKPEPPVVRRLRGALEELGPVFADLGRYLGGRVDLFATEDCKELRRATGARLPTSIEAAGACFAAEVGRPLDRVFAEIEPWPAGDDLAVCALRARLRSGEAVEVRLVATETEARLRRDLEAMAELPPALESAGVAADDAAAAVDRYRQLAVDRLDLHRRAEALTRLRELGPSLQLRAPRLHPELSTTRVLTCERLGGDASGTPDAGGASPRLARRLCRQWLALTLVHGCCPLRMRAVDLVELEDGWIGWRGAHLARLPGGGEEELWRYVQASARHEPVEALGHLLKLLEPGTGADPRRLNLELRQLLPFRDGAWTAAGDRLEETLFLHWRLARECGYRPRPHLRSFMEGLFSATARAREAQPAGGDPLASAVEDLRWLAGWSQLGALTDGRELLGILERNAEGMAALPGLINEFLEPRHGGRRARRPPAVPAGRTLTLALVLTTALLIGQQLERATELDGRVEGVLFAAFLILAFLLYRAYRSGGRTP